MKIKFLTALFSTLILTFWPITVANASTPGLTVEVYTYDPSALPDRKPYTLCQTETVWTNVPNVDANFDAQFEGIVAGCQGDFVLVHYTGYLTAPDTAEVVFQSYADDGFYFALDDSAVIDNWWLKGCSGGQGSYLMEGGVSYKFDAWFYEYGGGACNTLLWDLGQGLVVVPESAFSNNPVAPEPPVIDPVTPVEPVPDPQPNPTPLPTRNPVPDPVEPVPDPIPVDPIPVPVDPAPEPQPVPVPVIPDPVVSPDPEPEPIPIPEPTPDVVPEPTVQQQLDQLWDKATEDDIEVPENLASIPLLGDTAVAVINAINFIGNVGADMTPATRKKAKKVVVSAVIVSQIAVAALPKPATPQPVAQTKPEPQARIRRNK